MYVYVYIEIDIYIYKYIVQKTRPGKREEKTRSWTGALLLLNYCYINVETAERSNPSLGPGEEWQGQAPMVQRRG